MKFLSARPPVPPYLHLGSVELDMPPGSDSRSRYAREIDDRWRDLSAQLVGNRQHLREINRRLDERVADSSYTDAPYEVFYTVTADGRGQALIDYYF